MNISSISEGTTLANIGSEKTGVGLSSKQKLEHSLDNSELQHSRRFDEFVSENDIESDAVGIYNISKDENGKSQILIENTERSYGENIAINQVDIYDTADIEKIGQDKEILTELEERIKKNNNNSNDDNKPKRIGTMGMLEKNCRREGPNGTCNHNDDTPGAYTEEPIYA